MIDEVRRLLVVTKTQGKTGGEDALGLKMHSATAEKNFAGCKVPPNKIFLNRIKWAFHFQDRCFAL